MVIAPAKVASSLMASAPIPLGLDLGFMEMLEPRREAIKIIALVGALQLRLNEIHAAFHPLDSLLDFVRTYRRDCRRFLVAPLAISLSKPCAILSVAAKRAVK